MGETGRARTWILAFIAASGIGLGTLIGIGCAVDAGCPFGESRPFASTDGREIFLAFCAGCHGAQGEGGNGPSLASVATTDEQTLFSKIWNGKPLAGMPAFKREKRLTRKQVETVAAYVSTLRRGTTP